MRAAAARWAVTLLCVPALAGAYDLSEIDGDGVAGNAPIVLGWESSRFPLPVSLDPTPPAGLDANAYRDATLAGFFAWQDATEAAASFQELPLPSSEFTRAKVDASVGGGDCPTPDDCRHLVTAIGTDWAGVSGADMGVIALTVVKYSTDSRRLLDFDVLIDDEFHDFATNGDATRYDLQGIVTHEVGHALGVAHPSSAERATSTMWAVTPLGNTELRSLELDDITAARYLYAPLNIAVAPPDNNLFGLVQRAGGGGTAGDGGCDLGRGRTQGLAFAGLWLGLLGLGLRPGRRASRGGRRPPPPPGRP